MTEPVQALKGARSAPVQHHGIWAWARERFWATPLSALVSFVLLACCACLLPSLLPVSYTHLTLPTNREV